MARLVHLSDLHFGAHDRRHRRGGRRAEVDDGSARPRRHQRRFHPARARPSSSRRPAPSSTQLRDAGHEVLAVPGNHDVPLYDVLPPLPVAADPLQAIYRRDAVPVAPARRRVGARPQHRAVADVQGRADQPRAGRLHPQAFRGAPTGDLQVLVTHHPAVRAAGQRRRRCWARRSAVRKWRWTWWTSLASTCCSPGTTTARRPTMRAISSPAPAAPGGAGRHRDLDPDARRGAELQPPRGRRAGAVTLG